ncbi:phospholipase D-like domain-containing protein [Undibacterium terreum]|uniref:Phospholipase D family protein n=1 Tax=Undibacterium terreum TaxID=1224302 RepID=A0A916UE79_9BURK|nr:phospholipase D family protein [Undibacterium terreum]GGC69523.1 phospholipase D family protein [Undibacterium terreum]
MSMGYPPVTSTPFFPIRRWLRLTAAILSTVLIVSLTACAGLPPAGINPVSLAYPSPYETNLGKIALASTPEGKTEQSGFRLLPLGAFAFDTRIELIRRAQHTIDLQYYVIGSDESGRTVFKELAAAAARGVRVRMLVDDLFTVGQDQSLLNLSQQANVEVRLFNPFPAGRTSLWSKFLFSLNDFHRVNHRMHNKLFVADNAMAIVGGRNIGDEYFMFAKAANFIDLDTFVIGDIVRDLSEVFDRYWNSLYVYPADQIISAYRRDDAPNFPHAPDFGISSTRAPLPPTLRDDLDYPPLAVELERGKLDLLWAPATVFADSPMKVAGLTEGSMHMTVHSSITQIMRSAQQEVIVISPYFIPGKTGMEGIRGLSERKVRMVLVTNSLASTDSPLVHIGYSRYRKEMIKLGVEIHEINPMRSKDDKRSLDFGNSQAMLHAKIAVIDRKQVFIGSMNSDPRSSRQNTEMGVIIQDSRMAGQILDLMHKDGPKATFLLRPSITAAGIEWIGNDSLDLDENKEEILDDEPGAGFFLKLALRLLDPFAPEELL